MDPRTVLEQHRDEVLRLAEVHGASNVRIFGSVARGEASGSSDLDLLVEMAPDRSLFDLVALEQDLGDLLGLDVQVVSEGGLKARARDRILAEAAAV